MDNLISDRGIIESLRSGVPDAAAVSVLGSSQIAIEDRFSDMIDRVARTGRREGLLLGGGFGSGKSHLLRHLGLLAARSEFVVSYVVTSKETPLHDPVKLSHSIFERAVLPNGTGPAIESIASDLDPGGPSFADLVLSVGSAASGLDNRFAATLKLFAHGKQEHNDELTNALARFWAGEKLSTPDLRRRLRAVGEQWDFGPVPAADLARQRLHFAALLSRAAGYRGWIVLFDEIELVARYPLLARAKAYGEIGRWSTAEEAGVPFGAVFALTDDFAAAVLDARKERENLPARLESRGPEGTELARRALAGMRVIDNDMLVLEPPGTSDLDHVYNLIKKLHGSAFSWDPPDAVGVTRSASARMRQYVRAWINEWDLIRLDPHYLPDTRTATEPDGIPAPREQGPPGHGPAGKKRAIRSRVALDRPATTSR